MFSEFHHNHYAGPNKTSFHDWTLVQLGLADSVRAMYGSDNMWPPVISRDLHHGAYRLSVGMYAPQVIKPASRCFSFKTQESYPVRRFGIGLTLGSNRNDSCWWRSQTTLALTPTPAWASKKASSRKRLKILTWHVDLSHNVMGGSAQSRRR